MKLYHPYRHRLNQIFEFGMGKDEKRRFNNNLAKYPDDKCLLHYKDNPIEYKTNNYGFRSPEDIVEGFNGNVYIGCIHHNEMDPTFFIVLEYARRTNARISYFLLVIMAAGAQAGPFLQFQASCLCGTL